MPILPSGLNVGISDKRAQHHAAQKSIAVTMDTPLKNIYPLIDIVYANTEKNSLGKSYSKFAGFTLSDVEKFDDWLEKDKLAFLKWTSTEEVIWYLTTTRFRLTQCDQSPAFIKTELPYKFYSLMAEKIKKLSLNKASPEQWINTIGNLSKQGVTRDEFSSTGILVWLIKQKGKVEKQAILNKIRNSQPVIELGYEAEQINPDLCFKSCAWLINEYDYPDIKFDYKYIITRYLSLNTNYKILLIKYGNKQVKAGEAGCWVIADSINNLISRKGKIKTFASAEKAMKYASYVTVIRKECSFKSTRRNLYKNESLQGGKNYQENLVTLPNVHENYYSPHFNTRNVFAHIRTTERNDINGNKILFIEEIQSDWFSAAKKYGYTELHSDENAVPYVPLQKEWYQLCIKIILMQAIEQELAGVAWKPGHVHEDRAMGDTPGLIQFYDKKIPNYINRLTKSYGMEVTKMKVRTQAWNLHILKDMGPYSYSVDSLSEGFYTKSNLTKNAAELVIQMHSKFMSLEVPVVYIKDKFKEVVKRKGLSFYGLI